MANCVTLIILVGPSRANVGQHWPSDVLSAYHFSRPAAGTIELHLILEPRLAMART